MGHVFEDLSGENLAAAVDVHKTLGPGFIESVYENALLVALKRREISYASQQWIKIFYEGVVVGLHRLDLVVDEQIVVELKAVKSLEDVHFAQLRSYLKATGKKVGLLLNFNASTLIIKRVVL